MNDTDPESIIRQCMANTPSEHPDKESIERRLADPEPILTTLGNARSQEIERLIVVRDNIALHLGNATEILKALDYNDRLACENSTLELADCNCPGCMGRKFIKDAGSVDVIQALREDLEELKELRRMENLRRHSMNL